jgi:type IV secretion system protein VirB4
VIAMLKIIRDELGFGNVTGRERPMSKHIPYLRHVADTVIKLESGALLCVIRLNGLYFQTVDQAELNMRSVIQNTMIRALGSSRFSLWSTIVRREVDIDLEGEFDDPFCALLNRRYMAQLSEKRMFTNELYLSVLRAQLRGPLALGEMARGLLSRTGSREAAS